MPCPFPGMDPYLERPSIFADFHDNLISRMQAALQPLIRPKYAALSRNRLYVVESDRPRYPDVAVIRTGLPSVPGPAAGTAVLEPDAPAVFELFREEVQQR